MMAEMKEFIHEDFLLQSDAARELYHKHSSSLPIIDYHCHLNPEYIANDRRFEDLGQLWLEGDHYKWRAMRANGVDERFITGRDVNYREKFEKWAQTVPYTMRNPLYVWTHLELKRVFGIGRILNPSTAGAIYAECSAMLQKPEFSARGLMRKFGVEVVCTTDDPADSLEHHLMLRDKGFEIKVLPTWRADRAMAVEDPVAYREYVERLGRAADIEITSFDRLLEALRARHDFFASAGCRLSDHGIEQFYADQYTHGEIEGIFRRVINGHKLSEQEISAFKSALLYELAIMDWEKGWTQQFHYGALRNNNSRMFRTIGPDTGYDSIGDFTVARNLSAFLDRLDSEGKLARTIL